MEQLRKENQVSPRVEKDKEQDQCFGFSIRPHVAHAPVFFFSLKDLKARLKEEMGRTQAAVRDQRSQDARDGTSCDLEVVKLVQRVSPVVFGHFTHWKSK